MPKATVNEDGKALFWEHEIRTAEKRIIAPPA
jgi:hypothetical protein